MESRRAICGVPQVHGQPMTRHSEANYIGVMDRLACRWKGAVPEAAHEGATIASECCCLMIGRQNAKSHLRH